MCDGMYQYIYYINFTQRKILNLSDMVMHASFSYDAPASVIHRLYLKRMDTGIVLFDCENKFLTAIFTENM